MNCTAQLAGKKFNHVIMNASGAHCMTAEQLYEIYHADTAAIVTKSCTLQPRQGNPEPRYTEIPLGSLNSMGLPNLGLHFYQNFVQEAQQDKPIFISLAGLSLEENLEMLQQLNQHSTTAIIELNLSCPNLPGKPQTGYDFQRTQQVLEQVFSFNKLPLGVKLPPYFDIIHFEQMAAILNQYPLQFVTCINSIGNALHIDPATDTTVIRPKNGFGGLGGQYIKPTALANVHQFYRLLNPSIQVIGCGGATTGLDIYQHLLCGASLVQIGTQLMIEGPGVFTRLLQELQEVMQEKGYTSIDQFRGKLKYWEQQNPTT
ncbi:MAG: dihydroorotate oxidase [Weeksellaceae bacterium]|nr:dihydroorotate oxidase [Weeksellaceae bacterium]